MNKSENIEEEKVKTGQALSRSAKNLILKKIHDLQLDQNNSMLSFEILRGDSTSSISSYIDEEEIASEERTSSFVHVDSDVLNTSEMMENNMDHSEARFASASDLNMTTSKKESTLAVEMNFFEDSLDNQILQIDGFDDFEEDKKIAKNIFAINCEQAEVIGLVTFFRSFNNLWLNSEFHVLCHVEESCFFCHIRSSILRLRQERTKGPFAIKLNEFVSQIGLYEERMNFDIMHSLQNLESCIKNTFHLINQFRHPTLFKPAENRLCCDKSEYQSEYHIDLDASEKVQEQEMNMHDLLMLSLKT